MKLIICYFLLLILNNSAFNMIIFGKSKTKLIKNKINMYYEKSKDFEHPITVLPPVQSKLIINNWLNASIILNNKKRESIINKLSIDENKNLSLITVETDLYDNIYEFKVFMALHTDNINTVYFSWIPESHKENNQVVYLIVGKILKNELFIYRIAQNPYAINSLDINSKDLLVDLYNYHKDSKVIKNINFNELHNHDKRYYLSWCFHNN